MVNKSRGRPRTPTGTRERILQAARARFSTDGYAKTSLRAIARDADVDHALVTYYFGSKEGLFQAVTQMALSPAQVFDAVTAHTPPDRFGATLLRTALAAWDRLEYQEHLGRLLAESLTSPATHDAFREYLQTEMIARLTDHIGGRDGRERAAAVAAILCGLYYSRYELRLEPTSSMSAEDLTRQLAPAVNAVLHTRR